MTFSLQHHLNTPSDSLYLLMKSVPPQLSTRGAERVVEGNRSIVGWRMEEQEPDHFTRVFEINPHDVPLSRSVSSPSLAGLSGSVLADSHIASEASESSLAHFRYRFAIRVKRRFSYTWYLSCWIVRDLLVLMKGAASAEIALPVDTPQFPYMPGSQSTLEPEAELVMDDKNHVIATHTAAELKKKAHAANHSRSESALSNQSTASCASMLSNGAPETGEAAPSAGVGAVVMGNNTVMYPYMVPYPISMCCVPGTEASSVELTNPVMYSAYYPPGAYQAVPQMMVLPPMDAQTYQQYMSNMGVVMSGVVPAEGVAGAEGSPAGMGGAGSPPVMMAAVLPMSGAEMPPVLPMSGAEMPPVLSMSGAEMPPVLSLSETGMPPVLPMNGADMAPTEMMNGVAPILPNGTETTQGKTEDVSTSPSK